VSLPKTLILGLGNTLLQDEALGVRAVEHLIATTRLPQEVTALDGGTLGLSLLPYLYETEQVLFLDAVNFEGKPGEMIRLEGQQIPAAIAVKLSMHQVGLQDLLAALNFSGRLPERMVLWGMQPGTVDWGLELSGPVSQALPELVQRSVAELASWGVSVSHSV
jgi:hydrogenase maturation protease